ncbi:UBAP1-MVB12-associated (UMA)-domain containing protein 1 [Ornithorhynchus anatinus]|uniref:UBAP1-MVB12-associated (UMA)-domain containing protein 1 n=1 Tax=Ornithorhynchus anatinus TaxID=9258 RepID=UPI0010A77E27|nr:UBAP1-MVB12-associated (UMA)-domain containing protein 1 [Ornithorhynchus anatinus]
MFSFFRKTPDPKKTSVPEREADGFVLLGDTANEQRAASGAQTSGATLQPPLRAERAGPAEGPGRAEAADRTPGAAPPTSELLSDVPFTLAPHVLAARDPLGDLPVGLLGSDAGRDLARFRYDFTLENSVLWDA